METSVCKLTLICPAGSSDDLAQVLLAAEPRIGCIASWPADGHGDRFEAASTDEQLRARFRRTMFAVVLRLDQKDGLLETIRTALPVPGLAYWVEPVLDFGELETP